jgi:hypothetical protein
MYIAQLITPYLIWANLIQGSHMGPTPLVLSFPNHHHVAAHAILLNADTLHFSTMIITG